MPSALPPTELRGFLLTRHWRDLPDGTELEYWLATEEGPKKVLLTQQTSVAFLPALHRTAAQAYLANLQGLEVKELDLKTFDQQPVLGVYARRFRDLGKLARALQPLGIPLYEADVRPHDRYLMERFITAGVLIEGGQREGSTIIDGRLKPASGWRPVLKVVSLDIETSATEELYSIALDGAGDRVVFMLGEAPESVSAPAVSPVDFRLVYCPTRREMIEQLNAWFADHDPDVIVGWSVIQFDLRGLQKTADANPLQLLPGRERRPIAWRTHPGRQGYLFAPMPGRVVVDGIEALRAGMWSFPSFSLEAVSQALLGERTRAGRATCSHPCPDAWLSMASKHCGRACGASRLSASKRSRRHCSARARRSAMLTTRWMKSSGATRKTSRRWPATTSATARSSFAFSTNWSCCRSCWSEPRPRACR